jgi:hypothetical protein
MSNVALIVIGALLLAVGLGLAYNGKIGLDSATNELNEAVTGETDQEHVIQLVGGIALSVVGVACIVGGVSMNRRPRVLERP